MAGPYEACLEELVHSLFDLCFLQWAVMIRADARGFGTLYQGNMVIMSSLRGKVVGYGKYGLIGEADRGKEGNCGFNILGSVLGRYFFTI